MAIIQSAGNLADLAPAWTTTASYGSLRLYDQYMADYATMYRTQPNVRTCVDFLARNVAQLGLHVYRRDGETDRIRLREHGLALTFFRPNPFTTRYRLIESLMCDLGIWFNAYWLKLGQPDRVALLRIPPALVTVEGNLAPRKYEVNLGGREPLSFSPEQVVHFRGYNADVAYMGLSPLETLRRILAEEFAMGDYREGFWANAARMSGVIERPAEAPEWSEQARTRFKAEFEALYSGSANSGRTAILEEGMSWKEISFDAQESEYINGRKLTREECARSYHIPLPMVGILDNATFSNIREQHKNLYQDCLGPWLKMIEEEIELQLLPEFAETDGVYCEFNIAEKLSGSFEEQTQSLQAAVGRPWMTADEARARFNMPSMGGDADQLVTPLNVLVGGQASPRDSAPAGRRTTDDGRRAVGDRSKYHRGAKALIDATLQETRQQHVERWSEVLQHYFTRQEAALVGRAREGAGIETVWSDGERWDSELGDDLFDLCMATATVWAQYVGEQTGAQVDSERMEAYVRGYAERKASGINEYTRNRVADALTAAAILAALKELYDFLRSSWTTGIATEGVTAMGNFGSHEGAKQSGLRTKTWIHGGAMEPRNSHLALDGETVGIGDLFSNGMRWPGDPIGGAEENAYCHCSVSFGKE